MNPANEKQDELSRWFAVVARQGCQYRRKREMCLYDGNVNIPDKCEVACCPFVRMIINNQNTDNQ